MIAIDLGTQFIKICASKKDNSLVTDVFENLGDETTINRIKSFLNKNKLKEELVSLTLNSPNVKILSLELPKISKEELDNAVKFQAMTLLSISPENFEKFDHDYFVSYEDKNFIKVFFIALDRYIIDKKLEIISKCGLITSSVSIDGIGFANYYLKTQDPFLYKNQTIVLLNIGAKCSSFVCIEKGSVVFFKNIDFGGANLTERIQKEKNISFQEAEKIKKNPEKTKELEVIIKDTTKEFVGHISRLLEYLLEHGIITSHQIDKILVSGGGALTPFLEELLVDKLYEMVEIYNPIKGKKEGIFFSTVLGLI